MVLLNTFLQTEAGALKGLKALKDGLPFLASAGMLGELWINFMHAKILNAVSNMLLYITHFLVAWC